MKRNLFTFFKRCLPLFLNLLFINIQAQTLSGTYTTSWAGNTFAPTTANPNNFMQGWANSMFVDTDGTIYANSFWDEGAKELGIYKNGQCIGIIPNQHNHADGGSITANATYVWASIYGGGDVRRFLKSDYSVSGADIPVVDDLGLGNKHIRGLAASSTELFASSFSESKIKVYNASTSALLRNWTVPNPGPLALDASGNVWVLSYTTNSYGPGNTIRCFSTTGALLKTITLASGVEGKSIAINKTNNELYVTDIGPNMQIHIYGSINGTPTLVQSFGTQGGILSGTKGLVANFKFNVPSLVGIDGSGNLVIWSTGNNSDKIKTIDANGLGTHLESYTRAGSKNWEILGLHFVDMGTFDPASDGLDFYSKHEHITMDYSKPDGQQWTYKGFTVNRDAYPNDIRLQQTDNSHYASTTIARRVQGKLFLYMTTMNAGGYEVFRFDQANQGEIAIPAATLSQWANLWIDNNGNGIEDTGENATALNSPVSQESHAQCVDKNGTIWMADKTSGIRNYPVQSINSSGVPVYSTTYAQLVATPAPFTQIFRMDYDLETDAMYLSGYTQQKPNSDNDWGKAGRVLAKYPNWSTGNRTAAYTIDIPWQANIVGQSGSFSSISMIVEGDYIFVVGVLSRGKVWVYNTSSGALAGTMIPGSNVGGEALTGWCDLRYSVDAFKRLNGEYLVTVEEDGWEKVLIYRWTPGSGTATTPTVTTTSISTITGTTANSGGNVTSDGGASVSSRGVCWSTVANPTNANSKTIDGSGTGSFTSSLTGLTEGTIYNVRAYATNSVGTSYGNIVSFTATSSGGGTTINIVNNGIYELEPQCALGKRLNVSGGASTDGTNVNIWKSTSGNAQRWKLINISGNIYELEPQCALGKRLDINNGGTTNGTGAIIWTSTSGANQRWELKTISTDIYELIPQHATGMRLDVNAGASANGTKVQIWTTSNANAQRWKFTKVGVARMANTIAKRELFSNSIDLYPNPATDFVNICFTNNRKEENVKVEMMDLLGRKIYNSGILLNVSTLQINISTYPKGNYIMRIKKGTEQVTRKLIFQ